MVGVLSPSGEAIASRASARASSSSCSSGGSSSSPSSSKASWSASGEALGGEGAGAGGAGGSGSVSWPADYPGTTFACACKLSGHNPEKISLMLEAGADPNARIRISPSGEATSPLYNALLSRNLDPVVLLLRHGASLDSCRGEQSIEGVLAEEVTLKIRYAPWMSTRDYGDLPAKLVVLFSGVRRAGSYARYLQLPLCKEVMLLRSLALRRKAAPPKDPVLAFVCRAPNEIAWQVLGFWRATAE